MAKVDTKVKKPKGERSVEFGLGLVSERDVHMCIIVWRREYMSGPVQCYYLISN